MFYFPRFDIVCLRCLLRFVNTCTQSHTNSDHNQINRTDRQTAVRSVCVQISCPTVAESPPPVKKSAMDRKAELEKKKQKLAALRADKEKRRREKEAKDAEDATGRVVSGQEKDTRRDLDEMLSSLGVAPVSEVLSSLSSVNSVASDNSATATPDGSLQTISPNGQA